MNALETTNLIAVFALAIAVTVFIWQIRLEVQAKTIKAKIARLIYSDGFLRDREKAAYEQIRELNRKIKGIPVRDAASIKTIKEILDRLNYLAKDVEVKVKQRERIAELEKSNALLNERNKNQFEMIRAYQLKEKGEIIGAEAVEPFVQEGGEIEGFNSQVIREGKSHKIPNPDEVFEMLSKPDSQGDAYSPGAIESIKEQVKAFKPTQCQECGKELWLRDEDAGSDKEVSRLCDECFNAENSLCGKCGKQDELYRCEGGCNTEICSDCQATYDQFSQIDYSCCQDCADSNRENL